MTKRIYLDWNAGAPLRASVAARLAESFGRVGNASSVHDEGRRARAAIEAARRSIAALVGASPRCVTFTSGGTEGAATVLAPRWTFNGKPLDFDRLLVSAVEHPCVARGGRFAADQVETVPVDRDGVVDLSALDARLAALAAEGQRAFVSIMLANNETGVIQPVAEAARLAHAHGGLIHTDAVQAAGRIPVDMAALGADVLTLSAHKIGGPQGVGAIIRASEFLAFPPLLTGGGQEAYARAGTENAWGIEGFGVASEEAAHDLRHAPAIAARRDRIAAAIRRVSPEAVVFSEAAERIANTLSVAVPGLQAETALIAFDLAGVALSSGSACSSGKVSASTVLLAMGVPADLARSALRISIGPSTTDDEVARFEEVFTRVHADLTKRKGSRAA
ncbi:cysteine desulfurase family protein [Chthonobacter rhizosphaerae]|uniref:cysteine desulfurase family protein n=1 Tax=Chthonobacter rhizosphaerae TaxID=2735553 RepID=UPI0015EE98D3|nr:cysteine desulfurase family protein [Chthonobacter rhizosphaerae]